MSVFAQRPRNETYSFKTNNILFAAESVSWIATILLKPKLADIMHSFHCDVCFAAQCMTKAKIITIL